MAMGGTRISQETLKLIACITMLMDHIGVVMWPELRLRMIGRLAFPIFCFLLAEGIHYTQNPRKYGLRLLIGMLLSEIPFDLLFFKRLTWGHQSVMVTLFLGFLYGTIQKNVKNLGHKILWVLPFLIFAELLNVDYGGWGVAMICFFVLTRQMPAKLIPQAIGLFLICWMIGGMRVLMGTVWVPIQVFGVFALIPIWCYSGEKKTKNLWVQRAFYLFYPVHLVIFLLIGRL
jgi:hypothetical protein